MNRLDIPARNRQTSGAKRVDLDLKDVNERVFGREDEDRGGGMPLPSVLSILLEFLLDHKVASIKQLVAAIEDKVRKRERLEYIYNVVHKKNGDAYRLFIEDILFLLAKKRFVRVEGDIAELFYERNGGNFEIGKKVAIHAKKKIYAIVLPGAEREMRSKLDHQRAEIHALANDLRPDGPGIRPINHKAVEEIKEQIAGPHGFIRAFSILVDQHGRILDGRHRYEALKALGMPLDGHSRSITVADDHEAVAIAVLANTGYRIKSEEIEAIRKRLAATGIGLDGINKVVSQKAKRELIRWKLTENPSGSNRLIAEELGVSDKTVALMRAEMVENAEITHFRAGPGRGKRNGKLVEDGEPEEPKGRRIPESIKKQAIKLYFTDHLTQDEIAAELGISRGGTISKIIGEEKARRTAISKNVDMAFLQVKEMIPLFSDEQKRQLKEML